MVCVLSYDLISNKLHNTPSTGIAILFSIYVDDNIVLFVPIIVIVVSNNEQQCCIKF